MTGLQAAIVSGSALIVIIALLRAALRRHLPARLFPALWCVAAVRLLLPDEAVQFAEVFFFLTFLGLKHKIHLPDDVLCDRTGDIFFQGLVVCCYYFCQHITDQ